MTYYVEQWKDKSGEYHFTKPSTTFNKALTKTKYGFKTIAVFRITPKPGVLIAFHDHNLNTTVVEKV